ncbi:MAG: hypothetical protein GY811_12085 [Myxococcales bacterium]|nr:hypothetical protein [Myxococcales bacterium]
MSETDNQTIFDEVTITLRPDGIVEFLYTTSTVDVDVARKSVAEGFKLSGVRAPTLVHIESVKEVTRDARVFFSESEENRAAASRVALIIESPLGRILGNFFMGFNKTSLPLQLFTDSDAAVAWLLR